MKNGRRVSAVLAAAGAAVLAAMPAASIDPPGAADPALIMPGIDPAGLTPAQRALAAEIAIARRDNLDLLRRRLDAVLGLLDEELARPSPDLEHVAAAAESGVDELLLRLRDNRDRRLALYAELTPDQQARVHDALRRAMQRLRLILDLVLPDAAGAGPRGGAAAP